MESRAIGVFDSGLGGLTAVRRLRALAPGEDIVFFGDTANLPYGGRPFDELTRLGLQNISFLLHRDVKLVIAACGTVSSVLTSEITARLPVPFVDVIAPTAAAAAAATQNGRVGLLATPATIKSGVLAAAIEAAAPGASVTAVPCPDFVPLIERGRVTADCADTVDAAKRYLAPVLAAGADTVVLGCTHYALIADLLRGLAPGIAMIDSGGEAAARAIDILDARAERNPAGGGIRCFVTGDAARFSDTARLFLGRELPDAAAVTNEEITIHSVFAGVL